MAPALAPEARAALAVAYEGATLRWGELTADLARLAGTLAAAEVDATRLITRGAELVLAHAAAAADPVAVAAFETVAIGPARPVIRRYTRDDARTDEVVQRLRIHLLLADGAAPPRLSRFDGRAPLGAWIRMCAVRLALHELRDQRGTREVAVEWAEALAMLPAADPLVEEQRLAHVERVTEALRDACLNLSRRHRAIFRLIFVEAATIEELATLYQVHRVTVWRWVQEARASLATHLREHLQLGSPDDERLASLLGWVEGQIDLSLDGVLASTASQVAVP